ncbi:Fanconi anemia core complex-associated protein 100 isoform X1 [Grus americana]|uniref:Fanconi anemia core complex-associated protein 100 isoform X1 n=1 Tax=Grus americana TaxID=9117 RepID=UPI002407B8B2|nr:Fanconi anemia core complex-associated protein 100 isoform X1 [Grus americana]XP_054702275.1 Fanconi anemia core complex-associated protein 100 isoform X1 [Grus americana]
MAHVGHRVDYLAGFCCPVGGLVAGKPRVLCHENEIYLSNGSEFVYVYDQEGKVLKAVYRCPDQVWHVELLPQPRQLYILCAHSGIYCVSLEQQSRLMEQTDGDGQESNCPSGVFPVDSDACIFPDSSLCMFTLLNNFVITLSQAHGKWWMKLHELPRPDEESPPYRQVSEVGFCPGPQPGDEGDGPPSRFLPVLCCASSPGAVGSGEGLWCSGGFVLEEPLFSLLFGIDAAMLESPMILCGFPDGQLCSVPLKALSSSSAVDGCHDVSNQDPPVKILHHLEEPIVFIGALRTERRVAEDAEDEQLFGDAGCDCVVAVGHYGKMVAVKADQREEATVPELREYYLRGPILCAACGSGSRMYYSTHSDISAVDLDWVGDSSDPEDAESCTGVLPPVLSPASLSICSVVALSLSSRASEGESELLALSAKGRLMTCDLCSPEDADVGLTPAEVGRRIKELLSGIGNTSERVSFLKKAVDQKNRALASLNQVMNVSAALLSSQEGQKPIACTVTANWSCLLLQDSVTISCLLENCSEYSLEEGWTLCVQLLASPCALEEESVDSATTFTFPINQLLPGNKRELTLPLGSAADTKLDLPLTISCALYYSLRDILGSGSDSSEALDDLLPDDSPILSPDREGICLPLSECTIDMLQCLRFESNPPRPDASPPAAAPPDPVETFLKASREQTEPEGAKAGELPDAPGEGNLPPSAASIRVSSELLKNALKTSSSDVPLSCATLRWLLAENAGAEALSSEEVASVRGTAPDGGEVQLLVREVAMNDLSPAGPIQAVEILMESPSLADMCRMHHAVIRRIQALVLEQAAQGSGPPDLRMQYLRQIQANHEMLLKEAQTLRDRPPLGEEGAATAEKLLHVYRQLRNPSLVLL